MTGGSLGRLVTAWPFSWGARARRLLVLLGLGLGSLLLPGGLLAQSVDRCGPTVKPTLESAYERWVDLMSGRDSLPDSTVIAVTDSLVDELLALDRLAARILPDQWEELAPGDRTAFLEALRASIRHRLVSYYERKEKNGWADPRPAGKRSADCDTGLEYSLETAEGEKELKLDRAESCEGSCRIGRIEYDGDELSDDYRDRVEVLLEEYSFAYMVAELGDRPYVVLEDFESSPVGDLPTGWEWRETDDEKHKPYEVREENGNKYLAATDEGESVIIGKEVKWNLEKYPYASFRLRVHEIPEGGDERDDDKVDSAAGIYFTYQWKMGLVPESVKYVWSSTLPVGSAVQREGVGKPWQVVVGSGTEGLGEWRTYVFDLREVYRQTFGGEPPSTPVGVGILSDANSTDSRAYADYDDIRALRRVSPEPTSGVERTLEPTNGEK